MSRLALSGEERLVLDLVERQRGRANWHSIAILTGPTQESPVEHLRQLAARRLVSEAQIDANTRRYAITELGRCALHGREKVDELRLFAEAADSGPVLMVELFVALLVDQPAFAATLGRVFDQLPEHRRAVARGLQMPLSAAARVPLARRFFDDPSLLLEAWCPPRLHFVGEHEALLPDEDWDELLARGLAHPSAETRTNAAALAFATARGGRLVAPLLALAAEKNRTAMLALAGAGDPESLAALVAILDGPDPASAASAARALGARPDGADAFARALADPRDEVRRAAGFAEAVRDRGRRAGS